MDINRKISESLIHLIQKYSFTEITVAMLCREAGISRTCFYKHYNNTAEVLDAVLEQIFSQVTTVQTQLLCGETSSRVPLCSYVRAYPELQNLFIDDTILHSVLHKFVEYKKEEYLAAMRKRYNADEDSLLALLYFQLNGCIHVIRHMRGRSDEEWEATRRTIDTFIKNGYNHLRPAGGR